MTKINFYLPGVYCRIIGGYKTVYQYANYLSEKYEVSIYYNLNNGNNKKHINPKLFMLLKKIVLHFEPRWFNLSKKVRKIAVPNFYDKYIDDANISIATAFETCKLVHNLSKSKGKKIYFIQGYEKWSNTTESELKETYNYKMEKIVVSKWLKEIVDKSSNSDSFLISNGIDINKFKIINPIENRNPQSIAMLYHKSILKNSEAGIKIINKLHKKYPEMNVELYGSPKRPKSLPKWVNYTCKATEKQVIDILNKSSIFLCTSEEEGFGLPGLESMACGCALVTTNCLGILEYANYSNALIASNLDYDKMFNDIISLFNNNNLRISLAKKGNTDIKSMDLNIKCQEFEKIITKKGR